MLQGPTPPLSGPAQAAGKFEGVRGVIDASLLQSRSRTPVQLVHASPYPSQWEGRNPLPLHDWWVTRNVVMSAYASVGSSKPPPSEASSPWPHSWRKTDAISPVFAHPPPER